MKSWIIGLILINFIYSSASISLANTCKFNIPNGNECDEYDLSALNKHSGWTVNGTDYSYLINVCEEIKTLPEECEEFGPGIGFQFYGTNECGKIGDADSKYYGELNSGSNIPADWADEQETGFKVLYYNGSDYAKGQPRKFFIDFICDKNAGLGKPIESKESSDYTYKFDWRSSEACPKLTS